MGKEVESAIIRNMKECIVCGSPYIQVHHVFGASNRKISDRYGYIVPLCMLHHTAGPASVHFNRDFDLHLKKVSQKHFEAQNGTRDEFIRIFGRNYL